MSVRKTGRPCRGCRVGVYYGSGYCEKCQGAASTKHWAQHHKGERLLNEAMVRSGKILGNKFCS
ncbi:MAG: hypothetical protein OQK09_13760 [Colwellia sp.]|nr:hypothetical protein [Colwellia sp.]MCW8864233.1 hypothetical protein [Colwellia sp.]MCW9082573.1 hypothetical protein [Colwellia sp.]